MPKNLFDDLLKVYRSDLTTVNGTTVSKAIALNLPRGYVAHIERVIFKTLGVGGPDATLTALEVECALVNDPDDITSYQIPEDQSKHDVVSDFHYKEQKAYDTTNGVSFNSHSPQYQEQVFKKDSDIIAARNMRFNAYCATTDEFIIIMEMYYTLEKIKGETMLELLDIL